MTYGSIDNLQKALAKNVFNYTKSPKKAAGRALGTLVEIINFYLLKSWRYEDHIIIERSVPEYGNTSIAHNVEFSLHLKEVQDYNSDHFTTKLRNVFKECYRTLKDDGLLIFTYHHSRSEGWHSVVKAVLESGFYVVNSHPVKSEMSVATPKSKAKNPIQLDIVIVCRKNKDQGLRPSVKEALKIAEDKMDRLSLSGFCLSNNDRKIIRYGQLLTTLRSDKEIPIFCDFLENEGKGKFAQISLQL